MIAGLGVGGVAVALAVQSILGDLFASLSIVIDKPFVIGDFVIVDEYMGTIEHVGLKTTRIRSLGGEQIVFSNSDLLKTRIRNYKRMRERRVLFGFGVLYQTPIDVVEKIPDLMRAIVEARKNVRFERAHFKAFGESSLDFEVVYWMLDPDYNLYMDVQQAINLEMLRVFEREGIGFAYPTRTLVIDGPVRVEQSQEKEEAERESTGRKPSGRLDGDTATAARR
jgi:small-conductance mechanosensitive channel